MYVSVTGLELKSPWQLPRFYWHAVRALRQAKRAPGNLHSDVKTVGRVRHTLTAWRDRQAMCAFRYSDPHRSAIAAFGSFATGKTCGFESDGLPSWEEALAYWRAHGRSYGSDPARP